MPHFDALSVPPTCDDTTGAALPRFALSTPFASPDPALTPALFAEDRRFTWLKITNLRPADVTAGDFIVTNTGRSRARALEQGQYHFGYVKRAGE